MAHPETTRPTITHPQLAQPTGPQLADPRDDAVLAAGADDWLRVGLDCAPADREVAWRAVHRAYAAAGLTAPEHVVWLGSPAAGALAVALLSVDPGTGGPEAGGAPEAGSSAAVGAVLSALRSQGCAPGEVRLGRSVRAAVRTRPWARARAALMAELGPVGFARHWAAGAARPWRQLAELVVAPLRNRLDAQFGVPGDTTGALARAALLDAIHGQHDAAWLGAFAPARDTAAPDPRAADPARDTAARDPDAAGVGDRGADEGVAALAGVARAAGWWWAFEHVAVLTERPTAVHRDNLGRLHHDGGPALSYPDGFGLHAWRGMPIPPEVAAELESLTVERIRGEDNAEIRRVMLEHFGFDRFLRESRAVRVNRDDYGVLWRVDLPGDEPLVMVEVVNSTPEPDGSSRTYFLRVPPGTRTARAGVAWTFGLTEQEYAPMIQT